MAAGGCQGWRASLEKLGQAVEVWGLAVFPTRESFFGLVGFSNIVWEGPNMNLIWPDFVLEAGLPKLLNFVQAFLGERELFWDYLYFHYV